MGDNGNLNQAGSERSGDRGRQRPRTIAFFATEMGEYQSLLLSGVREAAREQDVNLLCLAGGYVREPGSFASPRDAGRGLLYELAGPENVDGIVVFTSGSAFFSNPAVVERLLARYSPLPMVGIGAAEGIAGVAPEFRQGMIDMLVHLIDVHGYRRIVFARGSRDNAEEQERYQAYVDVLSERGIPLDSNLVTPHAPWDEHGGRATVDYLLDQAGLRPGEDFEAVVGANDYLAIGILERLIERGVRVPQDVAVVGFDDVESARFTIPSLTTVHQPIAGQARQATEMLVALINGQQVPDRIAVPAGVLVRSSCGCVPHVVARAAVTAEARGGGASFDAALAARREDVLHEMIQETGEAHAGVAREVEQLLDAFVAEVGDGSPGAFLATLEETLRRVAAAEEDVIGWQGVLSALRRHAVAGADEREASAIKTLGRVEALLSQARILVGNIAQQVQGRKRLDVEGRALLLSEVGQVLSTTFDIEGLMSAARRELPRLGIPSCYVSLYENPRFPNEWSRLVMAYDGQREIELEPGGRRFSSHELVPWDLLPSDRRWCMIVEPLQSGDQQIGYALFEMGPPEGAVYESLRERFSSGLQGATLVRQSEERGRALQEANYALQRRAIQLEASAEVARAITSIFDVGELMSRTVDLIRDQFEFYHSAIFLLDDAGEWAVLREATGQAGAQMKAQGHRLAVNETSMVGWTALHRQPRIALDVGADAVRFAHPLLPHTRSEMTLPLLVGEQLVGVLNVQSTEEAAFDEDDIRTLQSMSNQVAVAIENARRVSDEATLLETASPLYRASRLLTTATTTTEVADAIVASVVETGADGCLVVEFEFSLTEEPKALLYLAVWRRDRRPRFQPGLRIPVSESPFPLEMVSTLWVVNDVERDDRLPESARSVWLATDARALVNIPLRSGDKVIGQVVVIRNTPGEFPESALRLYEALSDQAAVALERAQLLGTAQKYARQEQETRQAIGRIRQATDVEQALQATAEGIAHALEVSHVSLELNLEPPLQ